MTDGKEELEEEGWKTVLHFILLKRRRKASRRYRWTDGRTCRERDARKGYIWRRAVYPYPIGVKGRLMEERERVD